MMIFTWLIKLVLKHFSNFIEKQQALVNTTEAKKIETRITFPKTILNLFSE